MRADRKSGREALCERVKTGGKGSHDLGMKHELLPCSNDELKTARSGMGDVVET